MHSPLDEVGKVDEWTRDNVFAVAAQLSPLIGLDAVTLEAALSRAGYGMQPVNAATLAWQQIADTSPISN